MIVMITASHETSRGDRRRAPDGILRHGRAVGGVGASGGSDLMHAAADCTPAAGPLKSRPFRKEAISATVGFGLD